MSRKIVYFVRHGESILNAAGIRQSAEGGLSERGKEQAKLTGERMKERAVDTIISSTYERARETTAIINACFSISRPIEFSPLLIERRNPKEIIGKSIDDLEVRKIVDNIDKSFHGDEYRYSDEENFLDLKKRAKDALDYLAERREKNILVVTHGIFLRMIVAYILYGEDLTASMYNTLSFSNAANNAGITVCQYKKGLFGPTPDKRWSLLAWNDYTHEAYKHNKTI